MTTREQWPHLLGALTTSKGKVALAVREGPGATWAQKWSRWTGFVRH